MQPAPEVSLEFFTATDMDYAFGRERYSVFVHSKAAAEREERGTWRQPRTSRFLAPVLGKNLIRSENTGILRHFPESSASWFVG